MLHPTHADLANFIVLRMGSFHTALNFMSVIGKRFSNSGMRELVVEAGILGEGSAERALSGKHYNSGIRIFKYLSVAMSMMKCEVFNIWLSENKGYEHLECVLANYRIEMAMK